MKRFVIIGYFLLFLCLSVHAADIPNVLVLSDNIHAFLGKTLVEDMKKSMVFATADKTSGTFCCNWKPCEKGSADILNSIEHMLVCGKSKYRVALIQCGLKDIHSKSIGQYFVDQEKFRKNLKAIVSATRRAGMEVLWVNNAFSQDTALNRQIDIVNRIIAEEMANSHICIADYRQFMESVMKYAKGKPIQQSLDKRESGFLAESLAQWWTGIAQSNRSVRRIRLWNTKPPYYEKTKEEEINGAARFDGVSIPELEFFLPHKRNKAITVIFFPGGGYQYSGFLRNARELSEILDPYGIAVIGLKYRTKRKMEVPLADAQRAVRYVKSHAAEWGLDPERIGVAGQSAGAHLVLNLSTHFPDGNPEASDPVEKESSRPAFAAVFSSWNFLSQDLPFTFGPGTPPFFVRHARDDNSFLLAQRIVKALQDNGTSVDVSFLDKGGHGAFEISENNTGKDWPADFLKWLNILYKE